MSKHTPEPWMEVQCPYCHIDYDLEPPQPWGTVVRCLCERHLIKLTPEVANYHSDEPEEDAP